MQKSIKFFIIMLPAFFALVNPVSTIAKPACMKNTSAAPIKNHTPKTSLVTDSSTNFVISSIAIRDHLLSLFHAEQQISVGRHWPIALRCKSFRFVAGKSELTHKSEHCITNHNRFSSDIFCLIQRNKCRLQFFCLGSNTVCQCRKFSDNAGLITAGKCGVKCLLCGSRLCNIRSIGFDCGSNLRLRHIHHRVCFDNNGLAVVLQHDFISGLELCFGEHTMSRQHFHVLFIEQMRHTVGSCAVVEKTALFGCFLDPAFIIYMSFERNRGKINDKFFLVLCCVMLIMIVVSLIYYVVDVNTNEKLSDNLFTIKCNTF